MSKRIRVGVLFGGRSGEHEVSLASARSVMSALDREKYEVLPIGITRSGEWVHDEPMKQLTTSVQDQPYLLESGKESAHIQDSQEMTVASRAPLSTFDSSLPDVVFPVLHGPFGEDGTIQGLLEIAGLPYVGCGVAGSAVGMDKILMKGMFATVGLPQLPYVSLTRYEWERKPSRVLDRIEAGLRYPIFVKPANLGSSVGISKVRTREELRKALNFAASYDRRLVVEQGLERPREIEVAILGNDEPVASIAGEISPNDEYEFYDYESKYSEGQAKLMIPAPISEEQLLSIQEMAIGAFQAVDGAGLSRVDFLMDRETGEIYLNELNSMPGFTATSMYPKLWEATGLPYPQLLQKLIDLGLERYGEQNRNRQDKY
ncbi:MAG: D-alanine--D-alanine ligase [Ardenticatenaceae bacterium]